MSRLLIWSRFILGWAMIVLLFAYGIKEAVDAFHSGYFTAGDFLFASGGIIFAIIVFYYIYLDRGD